MLTYLKRYAVTKNLRNITFATYTSQTQLPRILFFGSDRVAFPSLKILHQNYPKINVVTQYIEPQRANKLKNQVEEYCKSNKIDYFTPIKQKKVSEVKKQQWVDFKAQLNQKSQKYTLGIVCSFGYMIPNHIIDYFSQGIIVVHPSILPKYRGASPIFHAIANGEKQSGVSYIDISKQKFDFGNILYQVKQTLSETATYSQTQSQLAELAGNNILHVVKNLENLRPGKSQILMENQQFQAMTQQDKQEFKRKLRAPLIKAKRLPIISKTAQQVYNWSRAIQNPRVRFQDMQIIIQFLRQFCQFQNCNDEQRQGSLLLKGKRLFMKCNDKYIRLKSWHQISKRQLQIHTFIHQFITNPKSKKQVLKQTKLCFQEIPQ